MNVFFYSKADGFFVLVWCWFGVGLVLVWCWIGVGLVVFLSEVLGGPVGVSTFSDTL